LDLNEKSIYIQYAVNIIKTENYFKNDKLAKTVRSRGKAPVRGQDKVPEN